jgi:hypothetical protein
MRLDSSRRFTANALTLLVAASALFCDGGGGGTKRACLTFTTTNVAAPQTVVGQQLSVSQCEIVQIGVRLTAVDDVFAASFTVVYDGALATFEGTSLANSPLTTGGTQVEVIENESPGQVTIGLTRLGVADGVDYTGTANLVVLIFQKRSGAATGAGDFAFTDGKLFGSETPPVEKAGIQWLGGQLHVER